MRPDGRGPTCAEVHSTHSSCDFWSTDWMPLDRSSNSDSRPATIRAKVASTLKVPPELCHNSSMIRSCVCGPRFPQSPTHRTPAHSTQSDVHRTTRTRHTAPRAACTAPLYYSVHTTQYPQQRTTRTVAPARPAKSRLCRPKTLEGSIFTPRPATVPAPRSGNAASSSSARM